ncbi:MAG: potassium-transporting ATPase subunit KdpC [Hyphomicrobium sp.]
MYSTIRPAAALLALLTLITGVAYPLAVTGVAQVLLPQQANGSLVRKDGAVTGSSLIGQSFTSAGYFHPRPSAAGSNGYDAAASSGSNLGPLSAKLNERLAASLATLKQESEGAVPADAVTTSGSGLDPHISIDNANRQVVRVANSRGVPLAQIQSIVDRIAERPALGVIGEPRINVLLLNLELDAELGRKDR